MNRFDQVIGFLRHHAATRLTQSGYLQVDLLDRMIAAKDAKLYGDAADALAGEPDHREGFIAWQAGYDVGHFTAETRGATEPVNPYQCTAVEPASGKQCALARYGHDQHYHPAGNLRWRESRPNQ